MQESRKILWKPSQEFIDQSNLKDFLDWLREHRSLSFDSYPDLWQWSIDELGSFWECLWEYFEILNVGAYEKVISGYEMPGAKWFDGTRLSYAEHIFRQKNENSDAIIFYNETGKCSVSWASLEQQVASLQSYLKANNIGQGDCVAAYLPNIPEAIVSFLAVNSVGAVWSCCSPDFGLETVIERLGQIKPKLLIAADGYQYNGKTFAKNKEVEGIRQRIPSIKRTLWISYIDESSSLPDMDHWQDIVSTSIDDHSLDFTRVPFDHPIWVLYSSGTTGRPKAITHSHGGVLLEHLKYLAFHNDVKKGENFFWYTTTGWMMWNFLQASMLVGATPVLYDGSPGYPNLEKLWRIADELPIHHFGTSAPFITACMKQSLDIKAICELVDLRSIGSTGAPLPPEAFEYVYDQISSSVWLCSMSGGTDVCTAFVGGNPMAPVYKGNIQARGLGCALFAYDENGDHVEGSLGEMVIEKPMPSMPIYFWNDPDQLRYRSSYFDTYPGKWRHGDWIKIYEDGSLIIQGRSDATLNRKGIRIGTAEIYRVVNSIEGIADSLIINLELDNGEDIMPLFVVLEKGEVLDEGLITSIKSTLRTQCSPRHIPDRIIAVKDIPYTLSGKKMEVPVKKVFLGMDTSKSMNRDAIRNPQAMDDFVELVDKLKLTSSES